MEFYKSPFGFGVLPQWEAKQSALDYLVKTGRIHVMSNKYVYIRTNVELLKRVCGKQRGGKKEASLPGVIPLGRLSDCVEGRGCTCVHRCSYCRWKAQYTLYNMFMFQTNSSKRLIYPSPDLYHLLAIELNHHFLLIYMFVCKVMFQFK